MLGTYTLSAAARMSGKSTTTLRRWAASGVIQAQKADDGQWIFDGNSLHFYLSKQTPNQRHVTKQSDTDELTLSMTGIVKMQSERIQSLERCLLEKDEEIKKLNAEMRAILSKDNSNMLSRWVKTKVKDLVS